MRINIISILAPLAAAAIITGCDKTATERTWSTDPDAVIVNASVGTLTRSNPLGNEEEQKKFNPGDVISIWQKSTNKIYDYVLGENGWAPVNNDKYMVWPSNKKDNFSAAYQYSASKNLVTDQSTLAGLASADCMVNEAIVVSEAPSDNKLSFTMPRIFSLVTVRIAGYNEQYNAEKDKISDLKIYLTHSSLAAAEAVSPYVLDAQGKEPASAAEGTIGWTYSAIGRSPGDNAGKVVFIEFKIAGKTETVTGIPTLENGKKYTFNLTVGKRKIDAGDISVSDWGSTGNLIEGGGEQDAEKTSDPISMTVLREQLKAWNEANPENKKELKDLITKELLDENCKKGKLIISGDFDNTTPAYTSQNYTCHGMSEETLEAFGKIAEYVRNKNNNVIELDLSGLKGLTAIGEIKDKNGNVAWDLSFYRSSLVTFIGSPDITIIDGSAGDCFGHNDKLVSVSGLENVTSARGAFGYCSSLSEVPSMPKVTNLRDTFNGTAIKELCHGNVEILSVRDCKDLTVIDCPKVNCLIGKAFLSDISLMNNLKELHLTSASFEYVHVQAFYGVPINQVTLYLNDNQKDNIDKDNEYAWTPKKSGGTSAVDGTLPTGTPSSSVSLKDFKAIYCGETQIK